MIFWIREIVVYILKKRIFLYVILVEVEDRQ